MEQHSSKMIQHLGIIAEVCKEIGLAGRIDRHVDSSNRKVSVGDAVVTMVLNAMGPAGRPFYLTPRFFENRPVDSLIREGLSSGDLHDYSLGTALESAEQFWTTFPGYMTFARRANVPKAKERSDAAYTPCYVTIRESLQCFDMGDLL